MSLFATLLILTLVAGLALLLAAPFIYLLRKLRRKLSPKVPAWAAQRLTWRQALPGLILVLALLIAFSTAHIAPHSWLGQRVATMEGKFWLALFLWIAMTALEHGLRELRSHFSKHKGLK